MKLMNYNRFIAEKVIYQEIPLPKDILDIANAYFKSGNELYIVGGCVRDFLQGKKPHDYDMVTNAIPEESKKILKNFNVSDEQGKNFGVLRVYTKNTPQGHEIAAFRKDISGGRDVKGDEQKVEIGKHITIEDDVKRRDLTMNAIFYDINKKEIVDLVGGVDDIKNNIIRTVGKPIDRFNEDRLRILRCLRFTARTGGKIDQTTSNAIKSDNRLRGIGSKDDVSQERIHEEWNKMLEHAQVAKSSQMMQDYIDLLTEYDMWKQMFPGMIIDTSGEVGYLNNAIIFYGLLNKDDVSGKKKMMVRDLKFTIDLVNQLDFLESYRIFCDQIEDVYKVAKLKERFHINDQLIIDFVDEYELNVKLSESFIKYCNDGFVVDGNELMTQGFKGKTIEIEKERREFDRFKNEYIVI